MQEGNLQELIAFPVISVEVDGNILAVPEHYSEVSEVTSRSEWTYIERPEHITYYYMSV